MLVNLSSADITDCAQGLAIEHALALPAGRAAAEDLPLVHWRTRAGQRFAPPPIATAYGTLLNHRDALAALGDAVHRPPYKAPPKAPVLYIKPRHCLAGHGAAVEVPADAEALQVGAQLGILIGTPAFRVCTADALAHVAGYTICSDLSVPHPSYYRPSLRYLARDGFLPLGPWIVAARHVPDPNALEVRVEIDGRETQRYSTAGMQRSVAQLIANVSDFMTLAPGDLLMLGAGPTAPLARAGQSVRVAIEPIGTLEHRLIAQGTA
jgi:5-oxopent-3-ene-1,2,5-tricarboxylate decarboxylase/2-hydroxyhepta-2,4-diene-1,7-dioate isomerase